MGFNTGEGYLLDLMAPWPQHDIGRSRHTLNVIMISMVVTDHSDIRRLFDSTVLQSTAEATGFVGIGHNPHPVLRGD